MNPTMKPVKVPITSDVDKLWSCKEMRRRRPNDIGKTTSWSGKIITIDANSATESTFCDGTMWTVLAGNSLGGKYVCNHQIDVD